MPQCRSLRCSDIAPNCNSWTAFLVFYLANLFTGLLLVDEATTVADSYLYQLRRLPAAYI
ncbi:hypothetical protein BDR05DRAFT_958345 [Suillus weaverae]|nr:hypothetical protein BDR05DRAFT_958345 [Suillus weaverae]